MLAKKFFTFPCRQKNRCICIFSTPEPHNITPISISASVVHKVVLTYSLHSETIGKEAETANETANVTGIADEIATSTANPAKDLDAERNVVGLVTVVVIATAVMATVVKDAC